MTDQPNGFYIAPFVIDGEGAGVGFWEFAQLSDKWLTICREHLEHYGPNFNVPWAGPLSHIRTSLAFESGIALVIFYVRDRVAASLALATGASPRDEAEVLGMFVQSLRGVHLAQAAAVSSQPFAGVLTLKQRPLMVIVPWPDRTIADQDVELVRELGLHVAGAFFEGVMPP